MPDDIAVAHTDYDVRGGAERVAEHLARTVDAPLYVGATGCDGADDVDVRLAFDRGRAASWGISQGGLPRSLAYMLGWSRAERLTQYDTIITSGNEPLWYVPPDTQTVVAYCHSTPRTQTDLWFARDVSGVTGALAAGIGIAERVLFAPTVRQPDLWVANSELVARRLRRYYNIPDDRIRVVYPPVRTAEFGPEHATLDDAGYVVLGRLEAAKRVGRVVDAFRRFDSDPPNLHICGDGPARDAVAAGAADADHITVHGYVTESSKRRWLADARAVIMPARNEDFGLVPMEAMASGTPVIGADGGFTRHQIRDGENGILYDGSELGLYDAVRRFEREGVAWDADMLQQFARINVGVDSFREQIRDAVDDAEQRARVTADLSLPVEEPTDERVPAVADGGGADG